MSSPIPRIFCSSPLPALPAPNDCYALLELTITGYAAPKASTFDCFTGLPKGY